MPVKDLVVVALGAQTEVVVRGGDGEALLYEHVHDVKVVALGGQHNGRDVRGEAGAAVLLLVKAVLKLHLVITAEIGLHP